MHDEKKDDFFLMIQIWSILASIRLQFIKKYLEDNNFNFYRFATLYIKKSTRFVPTYYVKEFDDNIWLDFPWESFKLD